jgi:hypothetical protein
MAADRTKAQILINAAVQRMMILRGQGSHKEALDIYLQIEHIHRDWVDTLMLIDAAADCSCLARWQDASHYAQAALAHDTNHFVPYDALAHAHSKLGQWDKARYYGLQALKLRNSRFGGEPAIPMLKLPPIPPPPSAQTREHNIIAFSLFGRDSKYCEPAILNAQEQSRIYPHWVCRFYVDGSVPDSVINRIRAGSGQIVHVKEPALQWPGPMWRLLALDDPQAHRILFRDADSVISLREAHAVEQWLTSGKRFHMMRDWGSHTELIMAGQWGVVAGSLPPLEQLIQRFMSVPLKSRHFADQHFLRQHVWPYARASLMQHDSVFGFMDAVPFPDGERPEGFQIGYVEGSALFTKKCDLPDGSEVTWYFCRIVEKLDNGQAQVKPVFSYTNTVRDGVVKILLPQRYARWIEQGRAGVLLDPNSAAA